MKRVKRKYVVNKCSFVCTQTVVVVAAVGIAILIDLGDGVVSVKAWLALLACLAVFALRQYLHSRELARLYNDIEAMTPKELDIFIRSIGEDKD
jgi:hypothetical protein